MDGVYPYVPFITPRQESSIEIAWCWWKNAGSSPCPSQMGHRMRDLSPNFQSFNNDCQNKSNIEWLDAPTLDPVAFLPSKRAMLPPEMKECSWTGYRPVSFLYPFEARDTKRSHPVCEFRVSFSFSNKPNASKPCTCTMCWPHYYETHPVKTSSNQPILTFNWPQL